MPDGQVGRLPASAHDERPWLIHQVAQGLQLEDVWALPAHGGQDDFPRLVGLLTDPGTAENASRLSRLLFAARHVLGERLGWDRPSTEADHSLRTRVPAAVAERPMLERPPFRTLYQTTDEWAAELANRTVHGVLHLGWVPDGSGQYRGQLAVLVRPNGRLGSAYLHGIRPFRYAIVYPALLRTIDRKWRADALTRP